MDRWHRLDAWLDHRGWDTLAVFLATVAVGYLILRIGIGLICR